MNYQKHYNKLIDRATNRLLESYTEKHHIIPKCMDGSNDIENIVQLTAREHFVAHLLLAKIHGGKLWHAANMMSNFKKYTSKNYTWVKENHALEISKSMIGRVAWNKGIPCSEEQKRKQSEKMKGKPGPHGSQTKEHKRKISEKLKGNTNGRGNKGKKRKPLSKEHRRNISVGVSKTLKGKING